MKIFVCDGGWGWLPEKVRKQLGNKKAKQIMREWKAHYNYQRIENKRLTLLQFDYEERRPSTVKKTRALTE